MGRLAAPCVRWLTALVPLPEGDCRWHPGGAEATRSSVRAFNADDLRDESFFVVAHGLNVAYRRGSVRRRALGRPFAGHRDFISELIGNIVENAIEDALSRAGISYRKTKRAERLHGFDQAPDFVVPNEFNPQVVIEAKLTEDDGTARDKVTRVQHLGSLSMQGEPPNQPGFEVVACIAGRGFGVRREDMKKLLLSTRGKVFTLQNMCQLVDHTRLAEFRSR